MRQRTTVPIGSQPDSSPEDMKMHSSDGMDSKLDIYRSMKTLQDSNDSTLGECLHMQAIYLWSPEVPKASL
jgi:hypothetical protein